MVNRMAETQGSQRSQRCLTQPTILSLPREVRDQIYTHTLLSPDPIPVCSINHPNTTFVSSPETYGYTSTTTQTLSLPPLPPLSLPPFHTCRLISPEVSEFFYTYNTFQFSGIAASFQLLHRWLNLIGPRNRPHLRNPHVAIRFLNHTIPGVNREDSGPRFKNMSEIPWQLQLVHPIGPGEEVKAMSSSIEACFRTLGSVGNRLKLKLELTQTFFTKGNGTAKGYGAYGEDLPRVVEEARRTFAGSRVEVVWEGFVLKEELSRTQEQMRERGWEMVEWGMHPYPGRWRTFGRRMIVFTARRT